MIAGRVVVADGACMENQGETSYRSWSPSQHARIDKACADFEEAVKAGKKPAVEDFLSRVPESERPALERELRAIRAELAARERPGVTLDQFRENLVRSGLLSEVELAAFQDCIPPEMRPKDVQGLARELIQAGKLTKFQAQAIYRGKIKGLVLGEYVVLDQIGAGGMGQVFKARHCTMDRLVALKTLPRKAMKDPEAVKRFRREVRAAAKLEHPNIVLAHDARETDGVHFLVMQHVDGLDLDALLAKRGVLSVVQAVDCVVQAARGLEYAHSQGVVHRDVKPANLLLDRNGTVKILDMGLARLFEGDQTAASDHLTGSGQMMGTCDYMAPEQAEDTHTVDGRADLYSLGCTLFRLLTGRKPYEGETLIQVLLAHRDAPIPSLREFRPDVPAELDAVFQRMIAKRPEDRYASMTEAIAALEACVAGSDRGVVGVEPSGDGALTAFLQQLADEEAAPRRVSLADQTLKAPAQDDTHRPSWKKLLAVPRGHVPRYSGIAAGMAFLVVFAAVIVRVATPTGTLEFQVAEGEDVEITVSRDGRQVDVLDTRTGNTLTLRPGTYDLDLSKPGNDLRMTPEKVTLRRGKKVIVEVSRVGSVKKSPSTPKRPESDRATASSPFGPDAPPLAVAPFDADEAKKHQQAWANYLGLPVERDIELPGVETLTMVLIPPGEFMMGSTAEERARFLEEAQEAGDQWAVDRIPTEGPQHCVRITRPFYLGKYEVTQAQWEAVMGNNPSRFTDGPSRPVAQVSWDDVQQFLDKLNVAGARHVPSANADASAMKFTLPTEAQWEYACRAGTTTFWHCGEDETTLQEYAWFGVNSGGKTHPVGELLANGFGLYDMHGNVWEWCADYWATDYYAESPSNDPSGPPAGSRRVHRGGCWDYHARGCRSAHRGGYSPGNRDDSLGFRLAANTDTTWAAQSRRRAKQDNTPPQSPGVGTEKPQANPERAAAEWALSAGGTVKINVDGASREIKSVADLPEGEFAVVEIVFWFNRDVRAEGLRHLRELQHLERFILVQNNQFADADLENLAGLKTLRHLDLGFNALDGSGLVHLAGLERLETLKLHNNPVNDENLRHLSAIRSLQDLNLGYDAVTSEALEHLNGLKNLRYLHLYHTQVDDRWLEQLGDLPALEGLNLTGTPLTDSGLKGINQLESLQDLQLAATQVTDVGLEHLKGIPNLETLDLTVTRVTSEGAGRLRAAMPACRIQWLPPDSIVGAAQPNREYWMKIVARGVPTHRLQISAKGVEFTEDKDVEESEEGNELSSSKGTATFEINGHAWNPQEQRLLPNDGHARLFPADVDFSGAEVYAKNQAWGALSYGYQKECLRVDFLRVPGWNAEYELLVRLPARHARRGCEREPRWTSPWRVKCYAYDRDTHGFSPDVSLVEHQTPDATGEVDVLDWIWSDQGTPIDGMPKDWVVLTAERTFRAEAGEYRLETLSDDGIRVSLDEREVLANWTLHGAMLDFCAFPLDAGERSIRVEYCDLGGPSRLGVWLRRMQ